MFDATGAVDPASAEIRIGDSLIMERIIRPPRKPTMSDAGYVEFVRRRLCLGSARDGEVASQLALLEPGRHDGTVTVSWRGSRVGVSSRW